MTEVQPMKMAAAEALYETEQPALVLHLHHRHARRQPSRSSQITIPYLLSFLATGTLDGEVAGHQRPAGRSTSAEYGPGDYTPIIPVTYWTFRLMIGFGRARRR